MPEHAVSGIAGADPTTAASLHGVLNGSSLEDARRALEGCCSARRWVGGMLERRPFASTSAVYEAAEQVFRGLGREDYLEAFRHHPAIGARAEELREAGEASRREQAGLADGESAVREELRVANAAYHAVFGYVFLIFATGKTAEQMLQALRERLKNDPQTELRVAAEELLAITRLRLQRLAP
jgi:OHCU decarboxylase